MAPRYFTALAWAAPALALAAQLHAATPETMAGHVRVNGRPEKNVVVWLVGVKAPAGAPKKVVLDQRRLTFTPQVLAVPAGTSVEMPNNDRVFHNVFSFKDGKKFDLGLYPVGQSRVVTFDRPGVSRIFCNIHPNMAAYVVAVDSHFVAVSDSAGDFTIDGVPAGPYTYRAWRPGHEVTTGQIVVEHGVRVEVSLP